MDASAFRDGEQKCTWLKGRWPAIINIHLLTTKRPKTSRQVLLTSNT